MISTGLAFALAGGTWPVSAFAVPGAPVSSAQVQADVAASEVALQKAMATYNAASERLQAVEASLTAATARLDELVEAQTTLQAQLGLRAQTMYRTGPLGFLEVLVGSATFAEFLNVWDTLMRLNRQDADTVRKLEEAKQHTVRATEELLQQQMDASRELRALEKAKADARKELAASTAAYASYQRQIAAQEAVRASAARVSASGGKATKTQARPARTPQPSGAGPWKTAVASHYGRGAYGIRLSSGVTIGPDSMIVAHKTLPFGTLVEFSYKGRIAVAKVMDRGPYTRGREWDLGPGTARVLGFRGVDKVGYRIIGR